MLAQILSNYRWNEAIKSKEMNSWISPKVKHVWNVSMYALENFCYVIYNAACPLGHYEPSTPSTKDLRPYSKLCKADISLKVKHVWNVSLYALQNFLQCQYNAACPLGHYEPSTSSTKDLHPYIKLCKAEISLVHCQICSAMYAVEIFSMSYPAAYPWAIMSLHLFIP